MTEETPNPQPENTGKKAEAESQPLMRSLGQFFGHIWGGVRSKVDDQPAQRQVVEHQVTEEKRGQLTLRETVIREVEVRDDESSGNGAQDDES